MRASEDSKFARAAEWMPRLTGSSTTRAAAERRNGSTMQAGNHFCDHVGRAFFLPARARGPAVECELRARTRAGSSGNFGECNDVVRRGREKRRREAATRGEDEREERVREEGRRLKWREREREREGVERERTSLSERQPRDHHRPRSPRDTTAETQHQVGDNV